jgi:uncharacterized protein YacL
VPARIGGRRTPDSAQYIMTLILLRSTFVLVAASLAFYIIRFHLVASPRAWEPWAVFGAVMLAALAVIALDIRFPRKRIEAISAVYFGLIVGLFLTYVARIALNPLLEDQSYQHTVTVGLGMILCYTCVSVLVQTKDDFRFIIPYVEFSKEIKGLRPCILDTSVVIDGRIADVMETNILDNQLIMPRFILTELQAIADSSDRLRRSRGRRGLDILNRLRTNSNVDLQIYDRELPEMAGHNVDMKLVLLAKHLEGKLITGDYTLNKIARLHAVPVINLNDLANAIKPVFLPGEHLEVRIVKPGEEEGQGVGYLDDGTMIVVEGGRNHVNEHVRVSVTSVLQTSAGRMIFGRFETTAKAS